MKMDEGKQPVRGRIRRGGSAALAMLTAAVVGGLLAPATGRAQSADDQVRLIDYYAAISAGRESP